MGPYQQRKNEISHFRDTSYRKADDGQLNYIWPFAKVNCEPNPKIYVADADEMGVGVFTSADMKAGEYLGCYFGIITHLPGKYSDYTFKLTLPNNLYYVTIDSMEYGNITRYFNHSYEPNCEIITEYHTIDWQQKGIEPYVPNHFWQYIESQENKNSFYYYRDDHESVWDKPDKDIVRWPIKDKEDIHITFYTNRPIKKGEQLFINYGNDYWSSRDKTLIDNNPTKNDPKSQENKS